MALARATKGVFVVAAKRTPYGTYGGKLMKFTATDLQEVAFRSALEAGKVDPAIVNSVVCGNVAHTSTDGAYMARHASLRVGVPVPVPALAVNRLCGSGFQAVVSATQEINCGDSHVVLTGGSENMSLAPYTLAGARFGVRLGMDLTLVDSMWQNLIDHQIKTPMGMTAENLADKYGITLEDCNRYALQSQQRWKAAQDAGIFDAEMAPVEVKTKKGKEMMSIDEHPKPQTTMEQMAKLPPVFKKGGTVNAGNASGICDGAGSVIVASEEACTKHNLTPLARVAGYGIAGCDPHIMGIGPVHAIKGLLGATGKTLADIDIVEVNEAFAAQYLAVEKELGLNPEITNMHGGAIALGHPVGASGSRITTHLVHELKRQNKKLAVGSACIGGGQGIAVMLEAV